MVSFCRKFIAAIFLVLLPIPGWGRLSMPKALVKINGLEISVDIPDTPALQYKGLGKRDYLPEFAGMLFFFSQAEFLEFHMKDMRFPIDIIWIRSQVIVDISRNVPLPSSAYLPTYSPDKKADMVLEVNANFTSRHNVRVGDKVEILPHKTTKQ